MGQTGGCKDSQTISESTLAQLLACVLYLPWQGGKGPPDDRREHEMITVTDNITGDVLQYEDIEDFCSMARHSFDESVHDAIDQLAEAYRRGEYTGALEAYLAITINN